MLACAARLARAVVGDAIRSWLGKYKKDTSPQLRRKKIARFTQHVVKAKASEIMRMCLKAQLEADFLK